LLDRLPAKDRARVLAGCERVELPYNSVLAEPGGTVADVYFPTDSFVSMLTTMDGEDSLEVSLAGSEGLYGAAVALGVRVSPVHALVQGGGTAWRMSSTAFRHELAQVPSLRTCVERYLYVLMSQLVRNAGCNRFHVVEKRLARWLLMTSDRAHSPTFHITHEFLAYMLGVRRVGVTEAASALQRRKLISYVRGTVTIRNRKGLEQAACGCYRSDLTTYKEILG
jgi:CRP-like cAMP-binding protein